MYSIWSPYLKSVVNSVGFRMGSVALPMAQAVRMSCRNSPLE